MLETRKHETPAWMDELLDRREITFGEYIRHFDMEPEEFWEEYWSDPEFWNSILELL